MNYLEKRKCITDIISNTRTKFRCMNSRIAIMGLENLQVGVMTYKQYFQNYQFRVKDEKIIFFKGKNHKVLCNFQNYRYILYRKPDIEIISFNDPLVERDFGFDKEFFDILRKINENCKKFREIIRRVKL